MSYFGSNVPMQWPSLCARCGEMPPTETYHTSSKHRGFGSAYTQFVEYNVPVCTECQAKLASRKRSSKILIGIGIVMMLAGFLPLLPSILAQNSGTPTQIDLVAFAPVIALGVIGLLVLTFGRGFAERKFANWNGKLFKFHNKSFHAAFANLNPSISQKV